MREDASRIPDGLNLPSFRTHFAAANGKCEHWGGGSVSPRWGRNSGAGQRVGWLFKEGRIHKGESSLEPLTGQGVPSPSGPVLS